MYIYIHISIYTAYNACDAIYIPHVRASIYTRYVHTFTENETTLAQLCIVDMYVTVYI